MLFETKMARVVKKQSRESIDDIRKHIDSNKFIDTDYINNKIENIKYQYKIEADSADVFDLIRDHDIVAALFAKNPKRQNIYETTQIEFLRNKNFKVDKLPDTGSNCCFVVDGKIQYGSKKSLFVTNQKSVDCIINDIYCSLKYTDGNGGAQDNQKNDLISFIKEAKKVKSKKNKFAIIFGGTYYVDKIIEELNAIKGKSKNIFIGSVDEFIKEKSGSV